MEKFKDRKIIKLLKKSPEDGIKMAIDVYGSAVNTICKNILINLNSEDIEEAISDTFFKLWKNVDNFNHEKNKSLKSYIYAIARNTCFDKLKSSNCNTSLFDVDENDLGIDVNMEDEYSKLHNKKISKINIKVGEKNVYKQYKHNILYNSRNFRINSRTIRRLV